MLTNTVSIIKIKKKKIVIHIIKNKNKCVKTQIIEKGEL